MVAGGEVCDDGTNDGIECETGCEAVALGYSCTVGDMSTASSCSKDCGNGIKEPAE